MKPTNPLVGPMLTDLYQLTMAYGYWKNERYNDNAVFDLFFRKNPFGGEYTVFAGLEEVLRLVSSYRFKNEDILYLKEKALPGKEPEFYKWLQSLDFSEVTISAPREGTIIFPREPMLRVKGPLAIGQLLETAALNLINYATLIATNAARHKLAAGKNKVELEFGLRRAQGPDGALSASRYSYMGGFDGTSNVLAGKLFDIPVKGTMAHAFIQSFRSLSDLWTKEQNSKLHEFIGAVLETRKELGYFHTNNGELAAFIAYAHAFPEGFLALVDTYNTLKSGIPNFICVALALIKLGHKPIGVRIDSGDLAYLSKETRGIFRKHSLGDMIIVASNDINEEVLLALSQQEDEINCHGIGTNLVTCQKQPALGGVYKLVEIKGEPRIKISEEVNKITIPGKKDIYRLFNSEETPILDLITSATEDPPQADKPVVCQNPFNEMKKVRVVPHKVACLCETVWEKGKITTLLPTLKETRQYVLDQLFKMRPDHLRALNPTPYKVSVSQKLSDLIKKMLDQETPTDN